MKLAANTGMMLLGIWLVLFGVLPLLNIQFNGQATLMQVLAIVTGAVILMNK